MKILGLLLRVVGGLLGLLILVLAFFAYRGSAMFGERATNPVPVLRVAPDSSLIPRGEHLASILCASCHGQGYALPLVGGDVNILAFPKGPTFGELTAPNLTPGGRLAAYSDGELARAIREGVARDGRKMLVMPSADFHVLSDRDLAALIAYLRSQPATAGPEAKRKLNVLGCLVLGFRMFPLSNMPPITAEVSEVPVAADAEYGDYLTKSFGCRTCHGADLRGGRKGQLPPVGPDLVGLAASHDVAAFERAVRQGVSALDGHSLDPEQMPYAGYAHLDSLEVEAIYARLKRGR